MITFTEKPELDIAKTFLASGDFYWNSGIFIWSLKAINKAFEGLLKENTAGKIIAVVKLKNISWLVEKKVVSVSMMTATLTESKDMLPKYM